jgi:hypothetical protein
MFDGGKILREAGQGVCDTAKSEDLARPERFLLARELSPECVRGQALVEMTSVSTGLPEPAPEPEPGLWGRAHRMSERGPLPPLIFHLSSFIFHLSSFIFPKELFSHPALLTIPERFFLHARSL